MMVWNERRERVMSTVVSLVLHVCLLGALLLFGMREDVLEIQPSVSVELWSAPPPAELADPSPLVVHSPPPSPPPAVVAPSAALSVPNVPNADIVLNQEKRPPDPKPKTPPRSPNPDIKPDIKEAAPKKLAQAELKSKPEVKSSPESKPISNEPPKKPEPKVSPKPAAPILNPLADDLLADLDSVNTTKKPNARTTQTGAASGAVGGKTAQEWLQSYSTLVVQRVRPHIFADEPHPNARTVLEITLLPNMEVLDVVRVHASGDAAYDEAVIRAVWAMKTFPPLLEGMKFSDVRKIRLEFRPH